ncbi:MAG: glycerol kinase GlpK [Dehalococcoidia bacterium]|jgi:glycerol kinase|nr:glycerol kinase GlpK [Dehalococcoidia bacterium]MDW8009408.1 glycerol kinase GlpK [Chloroflexota bacterium]
MGEFVLALDQGTSSSRAILFDADGRPVVSAQIPFRQHFPQPGWVEHDPEEIWQTQVEAAREALRRAGIDARRLAAIGIANQRETTVLWDEGGRAVANAIVWQDRRTAPLCQRLREEGLEPLFRQRTGLVLDPYFSGTKLAWLLDQHPELRRLAARGRLRFGTIDSWLLYRLTGRHATDPSNASRTLLFDLHRRRWDEELLRVLNVPHPVLPEVLPSCGFFGETRKELLGAPVAVMAVLGDQQAALFGQACFRPGEAKNTYGTGSFLLMNTGTEAVAADGLLCTIAWQMGEEVTYALEGSNLVSGAMVQWLRDGLGIISSSDEVESLARQVEDSGGVYVVPALTGLGSPYWDPHARGLIIGLTRGTTKAHIARATLEAMACQTRDVVEAMEKGAGLALPELRADGGAAANDLLLQLQADVLGRPVVRPPVAETTALGAAMMAGLAAGLWKGLDGLRDLWREGARFLPRLPAEERERLYAGWRRAVERARGWASDSS